MAVPSLVPYANRLLLYCLVGGCTIACCLAARERLEWERLFGLISALPLYKQVALALSLVIVPYTALGLLSSFNSKVLLVDMHCFKIADHLKLSRDQFLEGMRARGCFTEQSMDFVEKLLQRSGIGDATGIHEALHGMRDLAKSMKLADVLQETETIIFDVVDNLLCKTGTNPQEVGIVMTSCSCFAPTPSMAAMLVNRFKMRREVLTYSLAGMGCSSSIVCVDLARHMLKAMPNTLCLIVNHENVNACAYQGNDRSMLITNSLFRIGGAATLLSNRPCDLKRAKYELCTTLRTHVGADNDAHKCMGNGVDAEGIPGVFLRKNVIEVSGIALRANLSRLAPLVLPFYELAKCVMYTDYTPNFSRAFDHFLLHTGGKGVLDNLAKALNLSDKQMAASYATLHRFGNTSAASTWYILAGIENSAGVCKGDRLWQLGFGGGFKANSAVWKARRDIRQTHDCWVDEVSTVPRLADSWRAS